MFCPFCKAEYRTAIVRCSDCSFVLVDAIPKDNSHPNFMVVLWNGESLPFLEAVCAELDRAEFPVATPRVEVLLRDAADRYHLKRLKTFPYVLGVFKRDFTAARKILESVAKKSTPPVLLPPVAAYPEPFDESPTTTCGAKSDVSLDATAMIYSSVDLRAVEFVEASLDGVDISFRRVCFENGAYEIQVRSEDEIAARDLVGEIGRGTSSQLQALQVEDVNFRDDGPESYFLAWFAPAVYFLVLLIFGVTGTASDEAALILLGGIASVAGMIWMIYQAFRYEVRPFRYCVAAFLPFTFIWYYVERVMGRTGVQKLPISVRMQGPQT